MKLEFNRQIFEKYSNAICHENPNSESRVIPCGQTDGRRDGYDEANSRFSQFCEKRLNNGGKITRSDCDTLTLTDIHTMYGNKTLFSMGTGLKKKRELKF